MSPKNPSTLSTVFSVHCVSSASAAYVCVRLFYLQNCSTMRTTSEASTSSAILPRRA